MKFEAELMSRSNQACELCGSTDGLDAFLVEPMEENSADHYVCVCENCAAQLKGEKDVVLNHWRCLNDSMWSEVSAVKVVAYRMLDKLKAEGWPMELLEMMYLTEDEMKWAKAIGDGSDAVKHIDSNGAVLENGDSVVLIKDLDVKGANFTAKRGTAVRNIRLVHDNAEQIEGKVNGQSIVILTQYVKK